MRLRLAIVLMLLLAGGTIAVDRVSPAKPARLSTVSLAPDAGLLTCPYLTEPNARAYLQLANIGAGPSSVRVTIGAANGPPIVVTTSVPASGTSSMGIPAGAASRAGAAIEFSGGEVVATHMLFLPKTTTPIARAGGAAAAPCARAGGEDVVVTGATTLGSDATLALFNPGAADADVSVSLIADGRVFQPFRLSRRVIQSRTREDFRLGDYAFNARTLTAIVHANAGRVVAEGLIRSATGVELLPGQIPANEVVAIAGQSGAGSTIGVTVIGNDDSGIDARILNASSQISVGGFPPSLPPEVGRFFAVPDQGSMAPAAYDFRVSVGSPIVAETTWTSSGSGTEDVASLPGVEPASQWAAVIGAFQPGTVTRAVIVNPRGVPSTVHITTIGPSGPTTQDLSIPSGRLADVAIGKGAGTFAVVVNADGPVAFGLRSVAFNANGGVSVAITGEAFTAPSSEAVVIDQRTGIPATISLR
ncbi:MAG TPA: DUF5719 family protein [Actinomycetota bacterium]|nr:DUF5719 family protein [Actinomycetota bacterium]